MLKKDTERADFVGLYYRKTSILIRGKGVKRNFMHVSIILRGFISQTYSVGLTFALFNIYVCGTVKGKI